MPWRACLMVPLLWLRLLRQGRWIRTPMQIFETLAMDLFTYVNVHCTNLRNSWAGYSPTNKWCLPKLLRRVQVVQLVVSTKDSICGCSASLCINIDRPGWPIESLMTTTVNRQACGKWRILSFTSSLGIVFTSDWICYQGHQSVSMAGRIWYIHSPYDEMSALTRGCGRVQTPLILPPFSDDLHGVTMRICL
jgi:hypothetical protein